MKMLEQRIGRRRDATRALTQVPTGWGGYGYPTETRHTVGYKAINPRGMGTESPSQKGFTPNSKKMLTKGGESWSVTDGLLASGKRPISLFWQRDGGVLAQRAPRPGGPPHQAMMVVFRPCRAF
jgi:hypothetical protein